MGPAENRRAAMAGTINIGSGEHAARVSALVDAVGADDPLDVEAFAQAIAASIELGGGESVARQDRPKQTWFVVVGGAGWISGSGVAGRSIGLGDTVGEMTLPSDADRGARITADAGGMVLLEMDGSVVPEPPSGLRHLARTR